jgi:hypothetical protein
LNIHDYFLQIYVFNRTLEHSRLYSTDIRFLTELLNIHDYILQIYVFNRTLEHSRLYSTDTVHSKCINDQTLRSDIFLPKCSTNVRQIWESTLSLSPTIWSDILVLVGHFGRTWEWILKDIFFYISRGEYVKHFVIDAYL